MIGKRENQFQTWRWRWILWCNETKRRLEAELAAITWSWKDSFKTISVLLHWWKLKHLIKFVFGWLWLPHRVVTFWWETAGWRLVYVVWARACIGIRFQQNWAQSCYFKIIPPVCKSLLMHVAMNWEKMGEQGLKRGVCWAEGENGDIRIRYDVCRAKLWPEWRVVVDPGAVDAIYS